jgi:response regulator RpfG family c-di-GMP phosphodiesterase
MDNKILLVDDEDNITSSIKRVLRQKDYTVLVALSATDALEILKEEQIQVILSDQLMPGMTGTELFEEVQLLYPNIVRVLLTGYTAIEELKNAVNKGAVFRILFKPWDDDNLIQTIEEAFNYFEIKNKNRILTEQLQELNSNLEAIVAQKTRELTLHVNRLKTSQKLFDLMPAYALGLSDDFCVIDANLRAHQIFNSQALIGQKADTILPSEITQLLRESKLSDINQTLTTKTTLNNNTHQITCTKIERAKNSFAYLLYGPNCDD